MEREKVIERETKRKTSQEEGKKEEMEETRGERWMDSRKITGKRETDGDWDGKGE